MTLRLRRAVTLRTGAFLLLILSAWPSALWADSSSVTRVLFGPEAFVRKAGPPDTFERTVTVPPSASAPVTFHLINGHPDDDDREEMKRDRERDEDRDRDTKKDQDGDTIDVLHNRRAERIRLYGIDCPEKRQAFGSRAKQSTSHLAFGQTVTITSHGHDRYGRTIGDVILPDGKNLNQELVREGMCWWYRKYASNDTTLERLETEAMNARRGLWADPNPIPPWDWRKR